MPIVATGGTGKKKFPRYEGEFNVMNVKLYPDTPEGGQANLNDVMQNKYKKARLEIDKSITVTDRETGKPVEIADGLNVWFKPPLSFDELPVRFQNLYKLCDEGNPQRCKLKYYISVRTDEKNPQKTISRKRIATDELKELLILGAVEKEEEEPPSSPPLEIAEEPLKVEDE